MGCASNTEKGNRLYLAFYLDGQTIDKIWQIISRHESPNIMFICSDNSKINTSDIDVLKSFQNANVRRIDKIEFSGGNYRQIRLSVKFSSDESFGAYIDYSINGEDKEVLHLAREFEELISNCKLWYSFIAAESPDRAGMRYGLFGVMFFVYLFLLAIRAGVTFGDPDLWQSNVIRTGANYYLHVCSIYLFYTFLVRPFLKYIFPPANFAIGAGLRRAENARKLRGVIGGIVILGLIIGILANIIFSRLFS